MKDFLFVFIFIALVFSLNGQTDSRLNGVDKDLEKILDAAIAPGFAVAVVEKDKIVYAKGFGYSDYENKVKADANTLFAIGSCSKAGGLCVLFCSVLINGYFIVL